MTNVHGVNIEGELKSAAIVGDVVTVMRILNEHKKSLSMRQSRVFGEILFEQLKQSIDDNTITNNMNREEELADKSSYKNKFYHMIRYVDGISRKSHLQLSYIPTWDENSLFISDDGTMMSLAFGQFLHTKKLTARDISDILDDIVEEYDVDTTRLELFNNIREWVDTLTEQQKKLAYSFHDVIKYSNSIDIFNTTPILMEINLYNLQQHLKDQQNANLQPNPWIPHNFYKAPVKAIEEYHTTFLGKQLLDGLISTVPGFITDINQMARNLFRVAGRSAKRAELEQPFYMIKSALLLADSLDTILTTNKYFINYSKHETKEYGYYWYTAYQNLVRSTSYNEMEEFVKLFKVVKLCDWGKVWDKIKEIKDQTTCAAFEDLTPYKDDFATYITYVILGIHQLRPKAFSRTPSVNVSKITNLMIDEICNMVEREITVTLDNGSVQTDTVFNIFKMDGYRNWLSRYEHVWEPAIRSVYRKCESNASAENKMDKEIEHQRETIHRILSTYEFSPIQRAYSHQSKDIITINFNDASKTMAGLHTVPVAKGGTVETGIIWGLAEDNTGDWKYLDLNTMFDRPSDYWRSLGDHNVRLLEENRDTLSQKDIRAIERFIELCDAIDDAGISYKFKK